MAPAAAQLAVDLGDDLAGRVIAVGVDGRNRADSASRRPCARRGVIAHRNALATLYQWQQFPAGIADRIHPLEHSVPAPSRSEEHTSELQSLMRISYAVFCLKKKTEQTDNTNRKSGRYVQK